ncbi:DUF2470 domain-containing protein [Streptomyces sp. LaPpAH-108]|uniref:DUF2470 domain-containing protein n=1 Tax=Streptomyces sp. LaPpAH-108 TaxID=1155714 RepID=UPI00037A5829|nr:DUF2470 domain-containing protein [Streptomyces sp. LaPpAH-108]
MAPGPTNAERVRSVLARADSLSLTTDATRYELISMHTVDDGGTLRLRVPAATPLAAEAVSAPRASLPCRLHFTDIAPTPVRDRVRSRVALAGRLTPAEVQAEPDILVLRLDLSRAALQRDDRAARVGLRELAAARPDPLAIEETALLTHLHHDHADMVSALSHLADPGFHHSLRRLHPVALDRHGLVLRFEYARNHRDVRLTFPSPVRDTTDLGARLDQLLRRHGAGARGRSGDQS